MFWPSESLLIFHSVKVALLDLILFYIGMSEYYPEAHLEPCQTSVMELFKKIVKY